MSIMKESVFVDSNLWIYAFFPSDREQYARIMSFLKKLFREKQVVVSFQVVNEVCFHLRKSGFPEEKLLKIIKAFFRRCVVSDFSQPLLETASGLRKRHSFSYWDSLIVASATSVGCKTLYSEDMQDGRVIEAMHIKNPLKRTLTSPSSHRSAIRHNDSNKRLVASR